MTANVKIGTFTKNTAVLYDFFGEHAETHLQKGKKP